MCVLRTVMVLDMFVIADVRYVRVYGDDGGRCMRVRLPWCVHLRVALRGERSSPVESARDLFHCAVPYSDVALVYPGTLRTEDTFGSMGA